MPSTQYLRLAVFWTLVGILFGCGGGGGGGETSNQVDTSAYLQSLPTWAEYSPQAPTTPPTRVADPVQSNELIDNVPIVDPADNSVLGYRSERYQLISDN